MLFSGLTTRLLLLPFLALVITVHEFAHALSADLLGDSTAKINGRLTLNPFAHLDLFGTLCLVLAGFGWGKPVPFNPLNLRRPRRDSALIALAGPVSNFLMAALLAIVYRIFPSAPVSLLILLNLGLGFFNLLPFGPLDGFKVVLGFLPASLAYRWMDLERWGIYILFFLILSGLIDGVIFPLENGLFRLLTGA